MNLMNISSNNTDLLHQEILISTDINTENHNICVWDYNSGSQLLTYNNCPVSTHGLAFIKQDYMLCAINRKPFIYYFNLKIRTQQFSKITCPGVVNTLAITKCGNYIAVGINEKCFIWQTYSGKVVAILTKHLQRITNILFSSNDKYLITSSDDCLVYVWNFHDVLNVKEDLLQPVHTLNAHTLSINGLFLSKSTDKLVTVSADSTCKVWDLVNGNLVCDLVLVNQKPTRAIIDQFETNNYVACSDGCIIKIPFKSIVNETRKLVDENEYERFIGHKQPINCLALSLDNFTLASGSDDCTTRIWETRTLQCVKILEQYGPVTNLEFKLGSYFFNTDKAQSIVPIFTRYNADSEYNNENCVTIMIKPIESLSEKKLKLSDFINVTDLNENQDEYFEIKHQLDNERQTNEKLYNYALNKLLK